jgi:hypothetical protein
MLAVCLRSGHRTVPRLWHVFPKRVQLGPQHTFWCKTRWPTRFMTAAPLAPVLGADRDLSAPLVGGHKRVSQRVLLRAKMLQKPRPKATTARRTHATDGATPTHSRCCAWALGRLSAFACTSRGCPRTDDPAHAAESPRSAGTRAQRRPPPCWHAREPALNNWAPPRKSTGENSLTSDGRRDAEGPRRAPQPSGDARDRAGCAECTSGVARRPRARRGTAAMPRRRLRALLASLGGG